MFEAPTGTGDVFLVPAERKRTTTRKNFIKGIRENSISVMGGG